MRYLVVARQKHVDVLNTLLACGRYDIGYDDHYL